MPRRSLLLVLCSLFAAHLHAYDLIIPVVTGTTPGRTYSTTVVVENTGTSDALCTFTYRGPERIDTPLIYRETIPAGKTHIYQDFLSEIAAAGTVRVNCPAGVEVFARVQDSLDGARTFVRAVFSGRSDSATPSSPAANERFKRVPILFSQKWRARARTSK